LAYQGNQQEGGAIQQNAQNDGDKAQGDQFRRMKTREKNKEKTFIDTDSLNAANKLKRK